MYIRLLTVTSLVTKTLFTFFQFFFLSPSKCLFIYLFIFFWETQREHGKRGRERGEGESQAGSGLSAWSPMQGSISRTMRSWSELKLRIQRLTDWATQASPNFFLSKLNNFYGLLFIIYWPYFNLLLSSLQILHFSVLVFLFGSFSQLLCTCWDCTPVHSFWP